MTENHSTPDDAQRSEGEPGFSFTDKRKVREDGVADQSATPAPGAEDAPLDPIDAEAAKLYEQAQADGASDAGEADAGSSEADARIAELEAQVAALTEAQKRDQAEYVNSRRRIEASAQRDAQNAAAQVYASLFSVLDDISLAKQHGDLEEGTPFASIAHKLLDVLGSQGLEQFGDAGEEFDPTVHEALMHRADAEATSVTIEMVVQPGYRWKDRVLRPARVGTVGPE